MPLKRVETEEEYNALKVLDYDRRQILPLPGDSPIPSDFGYKSHFEDGKLILSTWREGEYRKACDNYYFHEVQGMVRLDDQDVETRGMESGDKIYSEKYYHNWFFPHELPRDHSEYKALDEKMTKAHRCRCGAQSLLIFTDGSTLCRFCYEKTRELEDQNENDQG